LTELLIVNDDDALRCWTERVVRERGYDCDAATNADDARELLAHDSYELVLLDIDMPDEPGTELLSHIRREHPDAAVVVIGENDPNLATTAIDLGAFDYMVKPVRSRRLLTNVANALPAGRPRHRALRSRRWHTRPS
jgi:DNA-binding NtrC family response regulator